MTASPPPGPGMPTGNQLIPVTEAAALTARFRAANPGAVRAWLFARDVIDALLAQPGASGIRVYRGTDAAGTDRIVIVATDGEGTDLLPPKAAGGGVVAEQGWPCPPICGGPSAING